MEPRFGSKSKLRLGFQVACFELGLIDRSRASVVVVQNCTGKATPLWISASISHQKYTIKPAESNNNSEEQISEHTQTYLYRTYRFFEKEKWKRNITECSPRVEGLV